MNNFLLRRIQRAFNGMHAAKSMEWFDRWANAFAVLSKRHSRERGL